MPRSRSTENAAIETVSSAGCRFLVSLSSSSGPSKLCFEGPEEELKLTRNLQPSLLTGSIAAFSVLRERGIAPDYVAGHSLGEYAALVAAGGLDFADAVRLVRKRGEYMQEAVPPGVGAMAALL